MKVPGWALPGRMHPHLTAPSSEQCVRSALLPSPAEQLLLGAVQSTGTGDALLCQLPRDAVAVSNTTILSKWRA